ncbi:MAG: ATP-dependent metallopeptidase FtsH/Yme1/Tma family protein, partial [Gammaproteobacteria bacterium]|nr:ATP-dependent metallopeptidase FtsH/Yme1/Tma family protein [Gammaproteobacteria bacterium]
MSDMVKNILLWLVVAVVLMSVFQNVVPDGAPEGKANYTQFIQEVQQGLIREVKISDRKITGVKRSGERFETFIPTPYDPDLLNDLIKQNVRVVG